MRNKLFYGLFPVYAVMVALVFYINGAFTGEVESMSNLVINGVFLLIIGVLFVISTISFINLNHVTAELIDVAHEIHDEYKKAGRKNIWFALQENKNLFEGDELRTAYSKYRNRIISSKAGRHYNANCDIEDYINEELLERVGKNFYNSGISGTMTGLGILGTFIGLSMGLGSFNGEDIYTISDNVGPLLTGMKVAFHTSVYGMIFSMVFNIVYRSIMADAYEKLDYFIATFKQCALPPTAGSEDENSAAMLVYQANMANYMKQMLEMAKGESKEQVDTMELLARRFVAELQGTLGAEFKSLGDTLNMTARVQEAELESSRRVLEAAKALVDSNRLMQESMLQMQKKQAEFAADLAEQKKQLEATCDDISRDVSNQLYTFGQMRNIYEQE